jgi:NADPH oxidase 2
MSYPVPQSLTGKERSRWPPLTRMLMSGEMSDQPPRELNWKEKFDRWMVNEGSRRVFVGAFMLAHAMIFAFGCMHYALKDNLTQSRQRFGATFVIARACALVLHVDVAIILFRKLLLRLEDAVTDRGIAVCRNLISLLRRTPLNGTVQFDKNITFHICMHTYPLQLRKP